AAEEKAFGLALLKLLGLKRRKEALALHRAEEGGGVVLLVDLVPGFFDLIGTQEREPSRTIRHRGGIQGIHGRAVPPEDVQRTSPDHSIWRRQVAISGKLRKKPNSRGW